MLAGLMMALVGAAACGGGPRPKVLAPTGDRPEAFERAPAVDPVVRMDALSTVYVIQNKQVLAVIQVQPGRTTTVPIRGVTSEKGTIFVGSHPGPVDLGAFDIHHAYCIRCVKCCP
jgi:hypothetical protein